ncbi:hypothetical protein K461DRAFT_296165 [Myriangium duriaei CBS 260.36]|uniref:Rhodopsin domain-containing protein n=1 Tax=Myriangium duriaei CBS 260.36 TaxID=1168546 RepID=A0A9P4ITI8_9PEZI|nr:hypothetical protein K461DRAFT_296165 [Myriangium duriaei CBS 260.36]
MYLGGVGPSIIISEWIQLGIAAAVVGLRAYTAGISSNRWRWDFVWMALALVLAIANGVFNTIAAMHGLGNHVNHLNVPQIEDLLFWAFLGIYFGTLSIACSKFSIIALLLQVQYRSQNQARRYVLWFIAGMFSITSVLQIFLTIFQCQPNYRVWTELNYMSCSLVRYTRAMDYTHAVIGGLTDIFLAVFPITFVWELQTSRKIKVGFCILMGVGVVPGAIALHRIQTLAAIYRGSDVTYTLGVFTLWGGIELCSLIILGSVPLLRPLFKRGISKISTKSKTANGTVLLCKTEVHTKVEQLDDLETKDHNIAVLKVDVVGNSCHDN